MRRHCSRRTFVRSALIGASAAMISGGQKPTGAQAAATNKPLKVGLMTYNLARDRDVDTII